MARYATMPERLAALRKADRLISKLRHQRPRTTGYVTSIRGVEGRFRSSRGFAWDARSRGEIPREPSSLELALDTTIRKLLRLGMTREELIARMEAGLAEAELARRKVKPRT